MIRKFDLSKVMTADEKIEARQALSSYIKANFDCRQLLKKAEHGGYICPFCGSGSKKNKSGAVKYYPGTNTCACFACPEAGQKGRSFDAIDLIRQEHGCDYNGALEIGAEALHVTLADFNSNQSRIDDGWKQHKAVQNDSKTPADAETTADYSAYYKQCKQRLNDPAALSYLQARGISQKTAIRCQLGFDPEADPASAPGAMANEHRPHPAPRIIIPVTKSYYIGRRTDGADVYPKINSKGGGTGIFGHSLIQASEQPLFVTEGAFDALSILECNGNAVALNSTNNAGKFIELLAQVEDPPKLIICLDNDDAGRTAEDKLAEDLDALQVPFIRVDICCGEKDANAALVKDPAAFKSKVAEAIELARQAKPAEDPARAADIQPKDTFEDFEARAEEQNSGLKKAFEQWTRKEPFTERQIEWLSEEWDFDSFKNESDFFRTYGFTIENEPDPEAQQAPTEAPVTNPADVMDKFLSKIQTEAYRPLKTGTEFFDRLLGGGPIRQTLILLLAPPGTGKSALCQQIGEGIAASGSPVVYLNYEMSTEQMLARGISGQITRKTTDGKYTALDILRGYRWTPEDRKVILNEAEAYKNNILPNLRFMPSDLERDAESLQEYLNGILKTAEAAGQPAPVLIVDYLHLILAPTGRRIDPQELIKSVVMMLKEYALQGNTFVIAISATNRESNKSGSVNENSGRDSSGIEYTGDVVLTLNYYKSDNAAKNGGTPPDISELQQDPWRQMVLRINKSRFTTSGKTEHVYYYARGSSFYGAGDRSFMPAEPGREPVPFSPQQGPVATTKKRR